MKRVSCIRLYHWFLCCRQLEQILFAEKQRDIYRASVGLTTPQCCRVVKNIALTAIQKDGGDDPDVTSGLFIL